MAFDESKDKTIAEWRQKDFVVSVRQYNGGERKLQIGPREVEKADGSLTHRKAGRLSAEEVAWAFEIYPEVEKALTG